MIGRTNSRFLFTPPPPSFSLSGGTETYIGNDKLLTFTSNGTLTVTGSGNIRLLIVGGGEGGATGDYNNGVSGYGGNGGEVYYSVSYGVTAGTYNVVVGTGDSSVFNITKRRGSKLNSIGTPGGSIRTSLGNGNNGTNGTTNDITGTSIVYASGGGGGGYSNGAMPSYGGVGGIGAGNGSPIGPGSANFPYITPGINYGAGGGGGGFNSSNPRYITGGANGAQGVVIIRYTTQ